MNQERIDNFTNKSLNKITTYLEQINARIAAYNDYLTANSATLSAEQIRQIGSFVTTLQNEKTKLETLSLSLGTMNPDNIHIDDQFYNQVQQPLASGYATIAQNVKTNISTLEAQAATMTDGVAKRIVDKRIQQLKKKEGKFSRKQLRIVKRAFRHNIRETKDETGLRTINSKAFEINAARQEKTDERINAMNTQQNDLNTAISTITATGLDSIGDVITAGKCVIASKFTSHRLQRLQSKQGRIQNREQNMLARGLGASLLSRLKSGAQAFRTAMAPTPRAVHP